MYANPYNNASVTHVHYPKAQRTYHLIYDEDSGHLVAMDQMDSRYYIGKFMYICVISVMENCSVAGRFQCRLLHSNKHPQRIFHTM